MNFLTANRLKGLILAALIAGLDRFIKFQVNGPLGLDQEGEQIKLLSFFDLTRTNNYGVSMGLFTAHSLEMRLALIALTAGIALVVLVWLMREKLLGDILPLALVLGGAIGNIYDRIYFGHVVDYADLHFGSFRPFLIFNLADAAISIGVLIILARSFLSREKRPEPETTTPAADPAATEI